MGGCGVAAATKPRRRRRRQPSKWGVQTLWLVLGRECIYFACFHRVDSGRMLLSMTMMMIMCVRLCVCVCSVVCISHWSRVKAVSNVETRSRGILIIECSKQFIYCKKLHYGLVKSKRVYKIHLGTYYIWFYFTFLLRTKSRLQYLIQDLKSCE